MNDKNKTKKLRALLVGTAFIAAFSMALALSSCKGDEPSSTTTDGNTTGPAQTTSAPEIIHPVKFDESTSEITLYNNPIVSVQKTTWQNYGTGDPFVMRYDGKYYLYNSTKDSEIGIKCWSSTDLVNWNYEGICANERTTQAAYAPEVTYYNGKFYMVTSPAGRGHYVLVSDSPTGPFKIKTENFGESIDGHIFIDNDGKWYFYRANGGGIIALEMKSPTEVDSATAVNTGMNIDVGGGNWTEGPMVIYHDGYYFITYTGNHVLNKGYRIYYGVSDKGPVKGYKAESGPILISTTNEMSGIGHSSSVKGPDLDSYYIIYHTLTGTMPNRELNIDRIVFNGSKMEVLGPTYSNAQISNMPDIYAQFDAASDSDKFDGVFTISDGAMTLGKDTIVLSKGSLDADTYTIELTTSKIGNSGKAGVIFGYKDENNYGSALFDSAAQKLIITFVVNGTKTENAIDLVKSFNENYNFAAVQSIQVENNKGAFTFYVNDRELYKTESTLGGGKIGVKTEGAGASFGYIGGIDEVAGSSNKEYYKPAASINGYVQADHCMERDLELGSDKRSTTFFVKAKKGNSFNYRVLAEKDGEYTLSGYLRSAEGVTLSVYRDKELIKAIEVKNEDFTSFVIRGISMTEGKHVITVYVEDGTADIDSYSLIYTKKTESISDDFSSDGGYSYQDGVSWKVEDGALLIDGWGKRLYGDYTYGDYKFEFDYTPVGTRINCGIIVRCQNPSETATINSSMGTNTTEASAQGGINWFQGYYIELTAREARLKSVNYSEKQKAMGTISLKSDTTYHIEIICKGATITLIVDGNTVFEYTDSEPFLNGMAGFRASDREAKIDNMVISPLD